MDCCGSRKSKEEDKNVKTENAGNENNPIERETDKVVKESHTGNENSHAEKEQAHGGCCGGGGSGMWLHLVLMLIVLTAIWYFSKR